MSEALGKFLFPFFLKSFYFICLPPSILECRTLPPLSPDWLASNPPLLAIKPREIGYSSYARPEPLSPLMPTSHRSALYPRNTVFCLLIPVVKLSRLV